MENASTVAAPGQPSDRGRFSARIMGKSLTASELRKSKDSSEHVAAGKTAAPPDSTPNHPSFGMATYTLRIKPDRRRAQIAINPETDRRRGR
jgi:hypothetical protein